MVFDLEASVTIVIKMVILLEIVIKEINIKEDNVLLPIIRSLKKKKQQSG